MSTICPICGMPNELCICDTIAKEQQKVIVRMVRKRYGKPITMIEGLDAKSINLKELGKKMKQKLACGGTLKKGVIELQGDHRRVVKSMLVNNGFNPENIEVV